jgi:hypothetical protein
MLRYASFFVLGLSLGCADRYTPTQDTAGFPEVQAGSWQDGIHERGLLDFLNDEGTTQDLLDHDVGIDLRAARSVVEHRDGPDRAWGTSDDDLFDDLAEVDALYYVGPATLDKIFDYALWEGWVGGDQEEVYGRWDGVDFTYEEAERVVRLANLAELETLAQGVDLDARAVDSIRVARPIDSVRELSLLYYVGESALEKLKAYAAGDMVLQDRPHSGT